MKDEYDLDKMKLRPGKVRVLSEEEVKIPISLRLAPFVVSLLRDEADRLGIPYQTLISSVLHRFVTGELVDKKTLALNKQS
jgi:predicted DNA binding CopG/RHH family protein